MNIFKWKTVILFKGCDYKNCFCIFSETFHKASVKTAPKQLYGTILDFLKRMPLRLKEQKMKAQHAIYNNNDENDYEDDYDSMIQPIITYI